MLGFKMLPTTRRTNFHYLLFERLVKILIEPCQCASAIEH